VPAARLADVGARDPQPLVLRGRGQHPPQQLTVAGLEFALFLERDAGGRDPLGKGIAHLLQLLEPGHSRLGEMTRNRGVDRDPGKRLHSKPGELVLEAGDLAPQLGAREALVASNPKHRERVSIEQIRHKDRFECKSPARRRKRETG
jgi:hypothetical protein